LFLTGWGRSEAARAALVASALTAACGSDPARVCRFGDPSQPLEAELVYQSAQGHTVALGDGARIPLTVPPQGGHVVLVAARVRNTAECEVILSAALRDPCNGRIVALEQRPISLDDDGAGWGVPRQAAELSDYANLPVCPTTAASHDLDEGSFELEVRVMDPSDPEGRQVNLAATVIPTCETATAPDYCRCNCDSNYILGQDCPTDPDGGPESCPVDAGVTDG
jgi:hypothetical protein